MEYRVYTYTPRDAPGTPRRRRRRVKRRRGISIVSRLALFGTAPVIALLLLCINLPVHLEQTAASGYVDENKPSAFEVIPAENDSIANAAEDNRIVAVEPTIAPAPAEVDSAPDQEYDFSAPVPESFPVEDSYFDDAVFIGDSRTEGLILNTGLSNATAYMYKGLMVDTVFTKPVVNKGGQKLSVMDALKFTRFSKVYIMLGINETGWAYSQIFQSKYGEIIDGIREINPNAVIYIQGIMPVFNKVSSTHS